MNYANDKQMIQNIHVSHNGVNVNLSKSIYHIYALLITIKLPSNLCYVQYITCDQNKTWQRNNSPQGID